MHLHKTKLILLQFNKNFIMSIAELYEIYLFKDLNFFVIDKSKILSKLLKNTELFNCFKC